MNELDLFAAAIAIDDSAARAALLDRECAGRPELRARLDQLLAANFEQQGEFQTGTYRAPGATTAEYSATESEGAIVAGRYKLLQQIGEGGMGTVWMADQTEPVKRRVAVKLVRVERGQSKAILARFEAERQAIALMDHPHIAKLLDAGTTEAGAPYFVMELVKGVPLNEYCDAHKLTITERLNLFVQICSAVQHAHQKGIIHRDIKPSNILVESHDSKPVPKVIDFGLAKATSGMQLTENTLFTGFGTVMGTPLYMAPEQANFNAVDVDTRADVYSLGVILYELLTGTTPLTRDSIKRAALDEMLKLIREQEAPTPSSRLSSADAKPTVAANRQMEPLKLGRLVKGELDWIVLKALSKDRDRRYETANGFAADIGRFLNHEAVSAGPVTAAYRMKKFVQRNRGQVIAASLVLLALLLGIVGTTWGLLWAVGAERQAKTDRDAAVEAEKIAEHEKVNALSARDELRFALYSSDMQMAVSAWKANDRKSTINLLNRQIPKPDEIDLRSFEWHYLNRQCSESTQSIALTEGNKFLAPDGHTVYVTTISSRSKDGEEPILFRVWDLRSGKELPEYDPFPGEPKINIEIKRFDLHSNRAIVEMMIPNPKSPQQYLLQRRIVDLASRKVLFTSEPLSASEPSLVQFGDHGSLAFESKLDTIDPKKRVIKYFSLDVPKNTRSISVDESKREILTSGGSAHPSSPQFACGVDILDSETRVRKELRAWNTDTGKEIWRVPVDASTSFIGARYSPDGKYLAELDFSKNRLILRSPTNGEVLHNLVAPGLVVDARISLHFNLDSSRVAIARDNEPGFQVWDLPERPSKTELSPSRVIATDSVVGFLGFGADGRSFLVSQNSEPFIDSHDTAVRDIVFPGPKDGSAFVVTGISHLSGRAWSVWDLPNAERPTFEIRIWDLSGKVVFEKRVDSLANSREDYFSCSLSPDGKSFLHTQSFRHPTDASRDKSILCLWDVESKAELTRKEFNSGSIDVGAVSWETGRAALTWTFRPRSFPHYGKVRTRLSIWDLEGRKEIYGEDFEGAIGKAPNANFSPDGSRIAWSLNVFRERVSPQARLWDSATGKAFWSRDDWNTEGGMPLSLDRPVFTPDGRSLIVSEVGYYSKGQCHVLDSETGRDRHPPLSSPNGSLNNIRVSPDGRRMFALANSIPVVWDLATRRELIAFPTANVRAISIDREGRQMRVVKNSPNSSDLVLETFDGSPLPAPK